MMTVMMFRAKLNATSVYISRFNFALQRLHYNSECDTPCLHVVFNV